MADSKIRQFPTQSQRRMRQKGTAKSKKSRSSSRFPKQPQQPPLRPVASPQGRLPFWQLLKAAALPQLRLFIVWFVLLAGAFGLGINLYRLQIVEGPELQKKARQQQMVYLRPYIPRRPIIDAQGNIVATDRLVYTLYAHPKLFKREKAEIASKLAGVLRKKTPQQLIDTFNKRESGIVIAHNLPEEVGDQVTALGVDGLELVQRYSRFYPQEEMLADVVGYVNYDHQGQAGVEYSQQRLLERDVVSLRLSRAGNGALIPAQMPEGFLNTDDWKLKLTVDLRVQRAARAALKEKMESFQAKRGTVIVMDVHNGSIVALVCEPTYDPNEYSKFDLNLFKNWAVADLYEPGSTFKPINVAIGLEAGVIQADEVFYDPGQIYVDTWPIANFDFRTRGGHGNINVTQILEYSSNVGMIKIIERLQPQQYYNWLQELGIDKKVGIGLAGEGMGQLKDKAVFTRAKIESATASFGQGFSLTPIKLVQLHAALANGGKLVTPHVMDSLVDPEGKVHETPPLLQPKQVFSPDTSKTVLEMMESVVANGTGKSAQIPGYRIAGKTGTAQKASPNGGYSNGKITSFVGMLPVESPRYVVLAVVDEPTKPDAFGSTVAAPIVKSVMETLISIDNLQPQQ
ncbi:MAG: peptidoglycan D,D-transpeptidase FtsI family protein [Chroococcales cyanobacterium]